VTSSLSGTLTGPATVEGGQSFDLTFGLSASAKNMRAQDLTVTYDADKLEWIGVDDTMLNENIVLVGEDAKAGSVRLLTVNIGTNPDVSGDIMKLQFKAKATDASTSANVSIPQVTLADASGVETVIPGKALAIGINAIDKAALRS
ncbi:cohesin domain-containing protein, partial [Paenibacillus sepulcri]|nr:cohesin domain-containing protein [Paenibacillus sepulcri]